MCSMCVSMGFDDVLKMIEGFQRSFKGVLSVIQRCLKDDSWVCLRCFKDDLREFQGVI